jgi:hypothetical protein
MDVAMRAQQLFERKVRAKFFFYLEQREMDASVRMAVLPVRLFGRASRPTIARLDETDALPRAFLFLICNSYTHECVNFLG